MSVRPYQTRCENELLSYVLRGASTVLHSPTGSGKTRMATNVIKELIKMQFRIGFTVHRKELLRQACRSLGDAGIPHGLIAPGHEPTSHQVHVASINTILSRGSTLDDWVGSLDLCVPDECHHTPADGYSRFIGCLPDNCVLAGLSATPWAADRGPLGHPFREVVRAPNEMQLTEAGYLAPVRVFAPPFGRVDALRGVKKIGEEFNRKVLSKLFDKPEFNRPAVSYYAKYMAGHPCIVWCVGVQHAMHVANMFKAAGWRAKAVYGDMDEGERERVLHPETGELATGETQVVCFADLLGEGVDIPAVSGAILLRPTHSLKFFRQVVGRIERPVYAPGYDLDERDGRLAAIAASWKPWATLIDLRDNISVHGMPDDEVPWTLSDGIRGVYRNLRPTTRCGTCFCVFDRDTRHCPACGSQNPISPHNATLLRPTLLRGYDANAVRRMPLDEAVSLARTQHDFNFIAASRRLPNGWAKSEFYAKCHREEQVALRRAGLA